jgi:hypothetical protein
MQIEQLDGGKAEIADAVFEELRTAFRGKLIAPDDEEFDEARHIWNGMIDRRPGLIAQCSGAADVIAAVRFAGTHSLLAVRGGGHSWPGHSVCAGGLMIDLFMANSKIREYACPCRALGRIGRCAIWPCCFCICWRPSPGSPVPAAPVPWWPSPCSSSTSC